MTHSRPQSPSFLGHVVGKRGVILVGYKLSRVALGTRMRMTEQIKILYHRLEYISKDLKVLRIA